MLVTARGYRVVASWHKWGGEAQRGRRKRANVAGGRVGLFCMDVVPAFFTDSRLSHGDSFLFPCMACPVMTNVKVGVSAAVSLQALIPLQLGGSIELGWVSSTLYRLFLSNR